MGVAFVATFLVTLCSKELLSGLPGFPYPASLAAANSVLTAAVSIAADREGAGGAKRQLPPWHVTAAFVALGSAAAVLCNVSLLLNSVAFYQGVGLVALPLVALVEMGARTKRFEAWHPLLYTMITAGVGQWIAGGWAATRAGFYAALAACAAASLHQFCCAYMQARWRLSPVELLSLAAPYQAALLTALGPAVDAAFFGGWVHRHPWTCGTVFVLLVTCWLAATLNISQCTAVKFLGPTTYQAFSQLATVPTLVLGSLYYYQGTLTLGKRQVAGAAAAAFGAAALAWCEWLHWAEDDEDDYLEDSLLPLVG